MRYNPEQGEEIHLLCPQKLAGARLDHVLRQLLPEQSRTFIQRLIDDELITVNDSPSKASLKLRGGESIAVFMPEAIEMSADPEEIPLSILFEDDDIIVVDKPPGIVVHPSPGHERGTLVNALLHHCRDLAGIGGVLRPGIVHRLDRDTSGCLVAAKNDEAHQGLMRQFSNRQIRKIYLAITSGVPRPHKGKVEGRIGRHPIHRQKHAMLKSGGRDSLTYYETKRNFGVLALVECDLKTGRTHQIRVHMRHLNSPILCDAEYGFQNEFRLSDAEFAKAILRHGEAEARRRKTAHPKHENDPVIINRQALHAWKLSFAHPRTGVDLAFESPLPDDMGRVIKVLEAE